MLPPGGCGARIRGFVGGFRQPLQNPFPQWRVPGQVGTRNAPPP